MSTKQTVSFTIRETTYYTGFLDIDADTWAELFGEPFDAEDIAGDDVQHYADHTGADVQETNADIAGQEWFDVVLEAQA